MKITRVETAVVEANYDYTFIRLHGDRDGLYGTGECFFAPGLTGILADAAPLLIGQDPRQVDRLVRMLLRQASGAGLGNIYNAVSGVDAALLDLTGKALGAPVYQLLGGKLCDQVRIYADCHAGDGLESWGPMLTPRRPKWFPRAPADDLPETFTPEMYARRARAAMAKGFDALKFDIDSIVTTTGQELYRPLTAAEIDLMAECVAAVRREVGSAVDVAVDCHWRFSPADAVRVCRKLEPLNLLWVEDPCEPANWSDTAEVKARSLVPILTGENLMGRHGFAPLIQGRACDLIAPDLQKCGGLLEGRLIGQLAEMHGIRVAPHCIAGPLGLLASAHVCATLANFVALEFHGQDVPFWNDLLAPPSGGRQPPEPLIVNGRVTPPERSGLGAELNEAVVREFAKPGEPVWRVVAK
jgi:gluconate/galactonate dehydratase